MAAVVTESLKRSVSCPKCNAAKGKPCRSSRIPGPSTFGGGWGGPPDLETAHRERRAAYLAQAPKCPGVDDAALASRAADLRASVGSIPGMTPAAPIDLMKELRGALTGAGAAPAAVEQVVARVKRDTDPAVLGPVLPSRCDECIGGVEMVNASDQRVPLKPGEVAVQCPKCGRPQFAKRLQVGDGVTRRVGSDSFPYTVVEILGEMRFAVREDKATRTDDNGMSDVQRWSYEPDPTAPRKVVTLRKSGWKTIDGDRFVLGGRRRFHDFSF